jgi:hypothetical protein
MRQVARDGYATFCSPPFDPATFDISHLSLVVYSLLLKMSSLAWSAPALRASLPYARAASSSSSSVKPSYDRSNAPLLLHPIPRPANAKDTNPIHHHINHPYRQFEPLPPNERPEVVGGDQRARRETVLSAVTGMKSGDMRGLRRIAVGIKRVVNMTTKGRV